MREKITEKITSFLDYILNLFLPLRSDFQIVKSLTEERIYNLPKADPVPFETWITPLFKYKDKRVKAIVWELKYKENILPLDTIGKMMFDEIFAVISDTLLFNANAEFILLPIPMTEDAKINRGFNQSELIAKVILEKDLERRLVYAPQWFTKIKETPKQSHSHSKDDRVRNLENSFEANENVYGKYIFLIDDVVTTASTLNEAKKTLLGKGAAEVFAFTIAH